ncbi:hypothetical protein [uncultured Bilophila sp.]|uniref:hypothetical protein n=1 Tax=uncultured Bilophila sp. TaxID=529385 RepID=UPI00266FEA0A|nr:hypothetical protein [uncultured Bilophila sp.]
MGERRGKPRHQHPGWRSLPCEQGKAHAGQGGSHVLIGGPRERTRLHTEKGQLRQ